MDWSNIRQHFSCTRGQAFLNTGTLGPVPDPVMSQYLEYQRQWNAMGPGSPRVYIGWRDRVEETRSRLASWLQTQPEDLTLVANVTDAINIALAGLHLPPGSRIVTSDEEHGALVAPLALLGRRGVRVEVVPYGSGGDGLLARIEAALEEPAALVALSHVSCETGAWIDGQTLARLCHERGALLMLDGAQSPGQMSLSLTKMEVDLYPFNGHKWMLAPVGCAGLYIRPEIQERVDLTYTGDGPGWTTDYPAPGFKVDRPQDGRRFEYGTRPWAAWVAWGDVISYWERLPPETAYRRQRELAVALHSRLREIPGVTLHSPELALGGIVMFEVDGISGAELYQKTLDRRVVGRTVHRGRLDGLRFCTSFFNNLDDVTEAAEVISRLVRKAQRSH